MRAVTDMLLRAARTDAKVLITGESGVGKEIAARQIHRHSARARRPLLALNCAGMPETLLESELFGHVRGSFTDAVRDKPGLLEAANGGTVFLDEVGEMSLRMQAVLLRFLETGEIQRVGAGRTLPPVDVRIVAATNRDLLRAVHEKEFRADLYYRLNVIHIVIPPLRERREDIAPLIEHFSAMYSERYGVPTALSAEVLARLEEYDWPGNVRELKNVIERLVVMQGDGGQHVEGLPLDVRRCLGDGAAAPPPPARTTAEELFDSIVNKQQSFWTVVYQPFMLRNLTRADVVALVERGLVETRGSYKQLVTLFNIAPLDYRRFLNFLRKNHCHVEFQPYRSGARSTTTKQGEFGTRASA